VPVDLYALIPIAGMATGALFMVGVYKLLARWMDQRHRTAVPPGVEAELRELRGQVAELADVTHRVGELEERLDFAERMLARTRHEPVELGPGGADA